MTSDESTNVINSSPIVVLAVVRSGGDDCDKYCWYDLVIIEVMKNDLGASLDEAIPTALESNAPQPTKGGRYIFGLEYYNPSQLNAGFHITGFRQPPAE